jgi:hypothetical protein
MVHPLKIGRIDHNDIDAALRDFGNQLNAITAKQGCVSYFYSIYCHDISSDVVRTTNCIREKNTAEIFYSSADAKDCYQHEVIAEPMQAIPDW